MVMVMAQVQVVVLATVVVWRRMVGVELVMVRSMVMARVRASSW